MNSEAISSAADEFVPAAEENSHDERSSFEEEDGEEAMQRQREGSHGNKTGHVHFGSVRVHTHALTLGDNPSAKTVGPPLALDWEVQESFRFSNVDEFSLKYHGTRDSLVNHHAEVLPGGLRQQIASQEHSAGSIRHMQQEIFEIRQHRKQSAAEDPNMMAEEEGLRLKAGVQKKKEGKNGFFRSLFHK